MTTPDLPVELGIDLRAEFHTVRSDLVERYPEEFATAGALQHVLNKAHEAAIAAMAPHIRKAVAEELTATTGLKVRTEIRNRLATFDASFSSEGQIDELAQWIIDLIVPAARLQERAKFVVEESEEIFALDNGGFIMPISADDVRGIKSPQTRSKILHAYSTQWEPLDDAREIGAKP